MVVLPVQPVPKPRMTRADAWRDRDCVNRYYAFKDELVLAARRARYVPEDTIDVTFYIPMPESWGKKKKEQSYGQPCKQKPDIDNLLKAFMDALRIKDEDIWQVRARKYWDEHGWIAVEAPHVKPKREKAGVGGFVGGTK